MPESLDTVQLQAWLDRMRQGDVAALDELLRHVCDRLERLARHMLRAHPAVQRWAETGDVLQGALLRLTRALSAVEPHSVREFFGLAAQQIRRELADLAKHYYGPLGEGANHGSFSAPPEPANATHDPGALAEWTAIHEHIEQLPEEQREVMDLLFYQALKQEDAAALLGVNVRTVQRRWHAALLRLHTILKDETPSL